MVSVVGEGSWNCSESGCQRLKDSNAGSGDPFRPFIAFHLKSQSMVDPDSNCTDCGQRQSTSTAQNEAPTNPATFVAPTVLASPRIVIEFCNRVRALNTFS